MKKLLLVIFFTIVPVLAHGATYYVAKAGSDSNSCNSAQSQSAPKLTINAGIGCLSAGDTLIVKAGTYNETIPDTIPSGTPGNPTIVKSEVQYGAVLQPDGSQSKPDGVGFVIFGWATHSRSYVTFDGFVLDAIHMPAPVYVVYVKAPDNTYDVHHITVSNNEIKNTPNIDSSTASDGFVPGFFVHDLLAHGNKIHDIGLGAQAGQAFYSYGAYFTCSNSIFENNEIYNVNFGYGIHMYNSLGTANNNIIRNNSVHDSGGTGILYASGGSGNLLYNNIVYSNGFSPGGNTGDGGIVFAGAGTTTSSSGIYNNTVYGNHGKCIQATTGTATNNTIRNNICYQNGSDTITIGSGSGNTIDHNLLGVNPLFVNATAHDFHLQAGGPAINAGVVIPSLPYCGSAPTLGALDMCGLPAPIKLRLVGN